MTNWMKISFVGLLIWIIFGMTGCSAAIVTEDNISDNLSKGKEWNIVKNEQYINKIAKLQKLLSKYSPIDESEVIDYQENYMTKETYCDAFQVYDIYSVEENHIEDLVSNLKEMGYDRAAEFIVTSLSDEKNSADETMVDDGVEFNVLKASGNDEVMIVMFMTQAVMPKAYQNFLNTYCQESYTIDGIAYGSEQDLLQFTQTPTVSKGYKKVKVMFDDVDTSDIPGKIEVYISPGKGELFYEAADEDLIGMITYMGGNREAVEKCIAGFSKSDAGKNGVISGENSIEWKMEKRKYDYKLTFTR